MTDRSPARQAAFRQAIEQFLHERLTAKLDKLAPDDPKRSELTTQFARDTWLADAARRVAQIQAVTHTLKAIHPDARGTNLHAPPACLPPHAELGSHALPADTAVDVVGNAAALDVNKLLRLEADGRPLLDALLAGDTDAQAALSDDMPSAQAWSEAFCGLVRTRGEPASHAYAKQLYWLTGDDPCDDAQFHLLAPLYASSLAHAVFAAVNEDRFGEAAKTARQARWEKRDCDHGYADYPDLAAQKLGGTKPQNISQLNSERGGVNYLLGSLPPNWRSRDVIEPWQIESVFPRFGRRPTVREHVRALRTFIRSPGSRTQETENQRAALTDALLEELLGFAHELHGHLTPGWSAKPNCLLSRAQCLWLDPSRAAFDTDFRADWLAADWLDEIGHDFGNWLNGSLRGNERLPLGDTEYQHWRDELLHDIDWMFDFDRQRRKLEHMPVPEMEDDA